MTANPKNPEKKKTLVIASVSCLVFVLLSLFGIASFFVPLIYGLSKIDHSEQILQTNLDYSELTRLSKISFSPNAIACKWEQRQKDNRRTIVSMLVPSPSDFDMILTGYVIVTPDETQNMLARYDWEPVSKDDPPDASARDAAESGKTVPITLSNEFGTTNTTLTFGQSDHDARLREEQRNMIDAMKLKERTLLYSEKYESDIQQTSPYGSSGTVLFDPEHNMIFFRLTHL